jgi:hypothetical protein
MPLYTYVATYRGASYIVQHRRSNFQGFGDWIQALPAALQKNAAKNMYAGITVTVHSIDLPSPVGMMTAWPALPVS